jgi:hypothetical protein
MVQKFGNGIVLDTENQLMTLLSDSQDLKNRINQFRYRNKKGPQVLDINKDIIELLSGEKFKLIYPRGHLINNSLSARCANILYSVKHSGKNWMR